MRRGHARVRLTVAGYLAPGGGVLVGDGSSEREPGLATLAAGFEADEYTDLATTVERVSAVGWTLVYGHVSTLDEWDAYEWSWTGSLSRWALDHPEHPDATEALGIARTHRDKWLRGYRGTLGFVTLQPRRCLQCHAHIGIEARVTAAW